MGKSPAPSTQACTRDTVLGGRVRVCQPAKGYRFSVDAVLLAHFVRAREDALACELGTGCGVVSLILASQNKNMKIWGVEIQPELAALARENARQNGLEERFFPVEGDLKELPGALVPSRVDLVFSNPPFYAQGSGRINPASQKALARHEIAATARDIAAAAARLLGFGGRFSVVYPARFLARMMTALESGGFSPKRLRMVHSRQGSEASLVLVESLLGGGEELVVERPLFLYESQGVYTTETADMLGQKAREGEEKGSRG